MIGYNCHQFISHLVSQLLAPEQWGQNDRQQYLAHLRTGPSCSIPVCICLHIQEWLSQETLMNRLKQKDKALRYGIPQPLMSWISG